MSKPSAMHVCRNPYGWSEDEVRDARLSVCDRVEFLERELRKIANQVTKGERKGWFDKVDYPNATSSMDLLKAIEKACKDAVNNKDTRA